MARRGGNTAATQAARQAQRQLGLHLLLHGLVLPPRRVRHEPGTRNQLGRLRTAGEVFQMAGGGLGVDAGL